MSERFDIRVRKRKGVWVVDVFDLDDHGADIAYASVTNPDLREALASASHYVWVAT